MATKSLTFELFGKDTSASKSMKKFTDEAGFSFASLTKKVIGLAAAYVGVSAVIDFGKKSVDAASEAENANAKLATAVQNVGGSMHAIEGTVEQAKLKLANYGFTGAQVTDALATLTTGLKDPAEALKVMSVAADLAKFKNIDLSSAALLVTKGMEGQIKPIRALGIDLPIFAGNAQQVALAQAHLADAQSKVNAILAKTPGAVNPASKAHAAYEAAVAGVQKAQTLLNAKASTGTQILDALSSRLKGQAAAAADTYAGKLAALNAKWDEVQVKIGEKLMPVLQGLIDWLSSTGIPVFSKMVDWVVRFKDVLGPAAVAIGVLTAAQWALNIAMDANPIGAVVLLLEALVGWIAVVIINFQSMKKWMIDTFQSMILNADNMGLAFLSAFQSIAQGFVNFVVAPINAFLAAIGQKTISFNVDFTSAAKNNIVKQKQTMQFGGLLNSSTGSTGRHFAEGGIVRARPGGLAATIGEAGHDEAVIPLPNGWRNGGLGSGSTVNIYEVTDPIGTANAVMRRLNARGAV